MKFNSLLVTLVLALTQIHSGLATESSPDASPAKGGAEPAANGKTANEFNKDVVDQYKVSKEKLEGTRKTLVDTLEHLNDQIQKLEDQRRKSEDFIKVTRAQYDSAVASREKATKEARRLQGLLRANIDDSRRAGNEKNRQETEALKIAKNEQQKAEKLAKEIEFSQKLAESNNKDVQEAPSA